MSLECQLAIEEHLDRCIDALIAGDDWRGLIPSNCPHREELVSLMQIGDRIREVFGDRESWDGIPVPALRNFPDDSPDFRDEV